MLGRILPLLFILAPIISHSQEIEVFGKILDAENQKPIYGANVIVFESTQGTTTNAQGFFKFSVPADKKSLVVSHIGYQTSKLEIPANNRFLLKLTKEIRILNSLDLLNFIADDLPLISASANQIEEPGLLEKDAEYPGGWKYFYNDVVRILKEDSLYKAFADSVSHLKFTVEIDGTTNITTLGSENYLSHERLRISKDFSKWSSAYQNGRKVVQYFDLAITNFSDGVFIWVDAPAEPFGGISTFYDYLGKNMKYPAEARRFVIQGKVLVKFIVDLEGNITQPVIVKGIGGGCDEEVLRLIKEASKWRPAKLKGKLVKQQYTLPIIFKLD